MKAILLNDGEYRGLENVEFPAEVDCDFATWCGCQIRDLVWVSAGELIRIGMIPSSLDEGAEYLPFFLGREIELTSVNAE